MIQKYLKRRKIRLERGADKITKWIGSTNSLVFHSAFFAVMAALVVAGFNFDKTMLIWNTTVSLEAIYLSIFIQMTVNKNTADIEGIQEDVEEIAEDVEGIAEDVEGIEKDVDEIQKDVDEIQEDVEEIEVVTDHTHTTHHKEGHPEILEKIQRVLEDLAKDVEALKNKEK